MAIWNVAYCLIVRNSLKHSVIIIRINNHIFDLQLILYSTYKMQLPWPFDSNQFYSNCIPKELKNYYLELLCNSYYLHLEINHNNLTTSSFCPDLELRPLLQMEGLNAFLLYFIHKYKPFWSGRALKNSSIFIQRLKEVYFYAPKRIIIMNTKLKVYKWHHVTLVLILPGGFSSFCYSFLPHELYWVSLHRKDWAVFIPALS